MNPAGAGAATRPREGRTRMTVRGAVQGVGFRPFVFRLATRLGLRGWVNNSSQGVCIEVEGPAGAREEFLLRLERERPPRSFIQSLEAVQLDAVGFDGFVIRASEAGGELTALVLPDIATCRECLGEVRDPSNRRYRYPFTNCTHCGPRFSIIEALPYDRRHTSMRGFQMCAACQAEYDDPSDRRFHAQPNACPSCGPRLALWNGTGQTQARDDGALRAAAAALLEGRIVAVKGLGGFHLMVRAGDEAAVQRLRERKRREAKPLATMAPSLEAAAAACELSPLEQRLLESPEAPIVLLRRRSATEGVAAVARSVAPGNPNLGVMLPATPLHHLLLAEIGELVVATSGNLKDEPICIDEAEALDRLGGVADLFLVHDRPIVRHVDDSIVRVVLGREMMLRRARGYAPLPVRVAASLPPVLAVGAHLKNTVALARGREVVLSQHIGDLETPAALGAFERVIRDLSRLYGMKPAHVAADAHPDYLSTQHARRSGRPMVCVQHHYAHVLACMAENDVAAPLLGVAWDGTGLGLDGTVWGGEFLHVTPSAVQRVGHFRPFRLPGGDVAVKEPRRSALGLLFELWGEAAFQRSELAPVRAFKPAELRTVAQMLRQGVNAPLTSSAGRLFDAVASLLGLRQNAHFEGQPAMDLEFAVEPGDSEERYAVSIATAKPESGRDGKANLPCPVHPDCLAFAPSSQVHVVDWAPLIEGLLKDLAATRPVWELAAKFHNTLAGGVVELAQRVGEPRVVLTGGCFQNRRLLEGVVYHLRQAGFSPYWHQRVPPNDGGIALGQAVAVGRHAPREKPTDES